MTVEVFPLLGKQSKLQMSAPVGSASFDDHIQTKEFLILHMYVVRTMSVSILCWFFLSGIESLNHSLLLVFLCGLKGSQLCVVYWLGEWRVNDYHQMPFKFQVLESFVRPTFTKDPKSISSTSHIKFCQCCQVHFHKLNGI